MAVHNHQRKQVAVLAADLVGSSSTMDGNEPHALDDLQKLRKYVFELIVGKFHGRIINITDVDFFAEFTHVVDAVSCSIEIQSAVSSQNEKHPLTAWIELRIGVSLDEVSVEGDEGFRSTLDISAGHGNPTESWTDCCAENVCAANVSEPVGVTIDLVHKGQRDPTTSKPTSTFLIRPANWLVSKQKTSVVKYAVPSIAILPFRNLIVDPEQEYFADRITEELIDTVSQSRKLRVISHNSSFVYKGHNVDIRQVASNLSVRYVLEGSVRLGGDKLRITGQLIEADGGTLIWADRYDGELEDGSVLQERIAGKVVGAIETTMRTAAIICAKQTKPAHHEPLRVN